MVTVDVLLALIDRYAEAVSARDIAYSEAAGWHYDECVAAAESARAEIARALAALDADSLAQIGTESLLTRAEGVES